MHNRKMRVAIDCDDAAVELKQAVYDALREKAAVEIVDLDYLGQSQADYPEIGHSLAKKIQSGEFDRGILICGTGLGMARQRRGIDRQSNINGRRNRVIRRR